jgi:hypothetical protein
VNLLAEEIRAIEEITTVPHTNHAENQMETNPVLQYGVLIGVLVVLVAILAVRKYKEKKNKK